MTAVSSNTGYVRLSFTDSEQTASRPLPSTKRQRARPQRGESETKRRNHDARRRKRQYHRNGGGLRLPSRTAASTTTHPIVQIDRDGQTIVDKPTRMRRQAGARPSVAYAVTQVLEGHRQIDGTATDARLASGQVAAAKRARRTLARFVVRRLHPQLSCAIWTGDRSTRPNCIQARNQLI
ncbi:MAG: hypothetical protein ACLT98_08985 [Eggerthellaceae bacterium]